MDISNDSEDTIILSNEPNDSEIEDILKKYAGAVTTATTSMSYQNNSNDKTEYLNEYFPQNNNAGNDNACK